MRLSELFDNNLNEGVHDKSIFKGIFVIGSPGSGKSTIAHKIEGIGGLRPVDPDMFFEMIYKKEVDPDLKTMKYKPEETYRIRHNVGHHNRKRFNIFVDSRIGFVFDGTGRDFNKTTDIVQSAEDIGYDTLLIIVTCELEEALKRNAGRARTEDEAFVKQAYQQFMNNIPKYQGFFRNRCVFVDSTHMKKTDPLPVNCEKAVRKFTNQPIMNPIALDWIEQNKG